MKFQIGKCYEHTGGEQMKMIGMAQSTLYGVTMVAESNNRGDFKPVGWDSDSYTDNWKEITEKKWMENFNKRLAFLI